MACPRIDDYEVSEHAQWAMTRRGILRSDVKQVLQNPEQSEVVQPGRCVYQSKIVADASSTVYLLRVFVDVDQDPPQVVTVYRTSRVQKYWR
jgi:hypothetical protein